MYTTQTHEPIPDGLRNIIEVYKGEAGADLQVLRLVGGKFPLWRRDFNRGTPIDGLSREKHYGLLRELGICPYARDNKISIEKERLIELFSGYVDFCRTIGGSNGFNALRDLEGDPLPEDLKREYIFLQFAAYSGNGGGIYSYKLGGLTFNTEWLKDEVAERIIKKIREGADYYTSSRFSLEDNLLFLLCVGANQTHDAPEGLAYLLLDKKLQAEYPQDIKALADVHARILIREIEAYHFSYRNEFGVKLLQKLKEIFGLEIQITAALK